MLLGWDKAVEGSWRWRGGRVVCFKMVDGSIGREGSSRKVEGTGVWVAHRGSCCSCCLWRCKESGGFSCLPIDKVPGLDEGECNESENDRTDRRCSCWSSSCCDSSSVRRCKSFFDGSCCWRMLLLLLSTLSGNKEVEWSSLDSLLPIGSSSESFSNKILGKVQRTINMCHHDFIACRAILTFFHVPGAVVVSLRGSGRWWAHRFSMIDEAPFFSSSPNRHPSTYFCHFLQPLLHDIVLFFGDTTIGTGKDRWRMVGVHPICAGFWKKE